MRAVGERRTLLNHFLSPVVLACPDHSRLQDRRYGVSPGYFILAHFSPTGGIHGDRDAQSPQFLLEWSSGGFSLNEYVVGIPIFILFKSDALKFGKIPATSAYAKQDNIRATITIRRKYAPSANNRVVSGFLFGVRCVVGLDNIFASRRFFMLPFPPPLPFQDCPFVVRGLLLPLGVPLWEANGHLHFFEFLELPITRPEGFVVGQYGRKFNDFPLI